MDVRVVVADITKQKVDAIVNAANKWCLSGSGVDGAIHNAAGPGLLQECRKLAADASGVRCPTGEARITGAGNLPCRFVIHAVGPDCSVVADKSEQDRLLASAYASSLRLAKENGVKTIAFPSISTGIFGFPIERAATIVAKTVGGFLTNEPDMSVTMCIFDPDKATEKKLVDAYTKAFGGIEMKMTKLEQRMAEAAKAIHEKGIHPFRRGPAKLPYIMHPQAVVAMLKEWGFTAEGDPMTICVGWAHDMIEEASDREEAARAIKAAGMELGPKILKAVELLSWDGKSPKEGYLQRVGREAAPEILAVKLADRLCNTLDFCKAGNPWGRGYLDSGLQCLFGRVTEVPHADAILKSLEYVKAEVSKLPSDGGDSGKKKVRGKSSKKTSVTGDGTPHASRATVQGKGLADADCAFLEKVTTDLAFIIQRINRQLSKPGREPGPGTTALANFERIDIDKLKSLAKEDQSGQAARLIEVYDEVVNSKAKGWRTVVMEKKWRPKLYDKKDPSSSTSMSEWGFDRSKVSVSSRTVKAKKKPNAGFPDALTAEMLRGFDMKKKGSTHPHHGYIDGVHYIAKCAKWGEEIFPTVPTSDGHVHNEYLADCFLREAGLNVPESREYWVDFGDGKGLRVVRLARYIEDTQPLEDAFKMTDSPGAMADRVLAAYPIQSFIAGIDTFRNDNVIVDREGTLWYVDNGASFDYRATGPTKGWWFDRCDVDDPNTGYLALRNFPNALQLQMMLKMSDDELWKAGADFDFIALAEKLPPELKKPAVLEYARLLNERMKRLVK